MKSSTLYKWLLAITNPSAPRAILCSTLLIFLLLPAYAQYPTIKWQYDVPAPAFGSAAAADVDGDGFLEIVFTTYTNDGKAHCLNAEDGSVRWIVDIGGCGDVAPLIYDADGDDTLDVFVIGSCNPEAFCINGYTGAIKWRRPCGGGDSPPTLADMDGDGLPELLFGNFSGQLYILNAEDGSTDKIIQVDPHNGPIQTEPTLVDINQDGVFEIIVANHFNQSGLYVRAYDYQTGDTLWQNMIQDTSVYNAYHGGVVADVDGDGTLEYIIGSHNGMIRALNCEDGTEQWRKMMPISNMGALSLADLDADGSLELISVNNDWVSLDERLWILDAATGNTKWSYPTGFSSFRGCAIGDINGNDTLDLVAGFFMGKVMAIEPFTGLIWEFQTGNYLPSGLPYWDADHGPLLADFDKNGSMDVFIMSGYGTYIPDSQNVGKAFMLEAGIGKCPEWLMFRQNVHRTGFLSPDDVDSMCMPVSRQTELSVSEIKFQAYPNPAQNTLNLYPIPDGRVRIIDAQGRSLPAQIAEHSAEQLLLDVSAYSPGLKIIELQHAGQMYRIPWVKMP
jgi:outer membrane protein assembly factor BamB